MRNQVSARAAVALLFIGIAGAAVGLLSAQPATIRFVPPDLEDTSWLQARREAQLKAAARASVFHDFGFTDRLAQSGISFRHRIVDDAGKTYKAAHYDHGNGMAIADVDGDGRLDIYFVNQVGGNGLMRNQGNGRFEDITAAAGVAVPGKVSVTASFADIDDEGIRISSSPRCGAGTCSSKTTARVASATLPPPRAWSTWGTRPAPCSSTTTAMACSTCSWSISGAIRRIPLPGKVHLLRCARGRVLGPPEAGTYRAQHSLS